MSDYNPYEPPKADLTPPPALAGGAGVLLPEPRSLPAGASYQWLAASWSLVKSHLGTWVLLVLTLFMVQMVFSLLLSQLMDGGLSLLGILLITVISALLNGGILLGVRDISQGQPLQVGYLFEGFRQKLAPLATLGLVSFAVAQAVEYIVKEVAGFDFEALLQTGVAAPDVGWGQIMPEQMVVMVAVYLLNMMLFWFATQLVALNDVPVWQALGMSFKGCLRNPLPLLLYALLVFLLLILGAIPLLLGWLVVIPWLFVSTYFSYRQIFIQ